VDDPRDAALAVAWAENLGGQRGSWPWWMTPRRRPTGWRAWAWGFHLAWMLAAVAYACVVVVPGVWDALPGFSRWLIAGFLIYGLLSLPVILWLIVRAHWNAPEADRKNRGLLTPNA
jgi:hypothetical protein